MLKSWNKLGAVVTDMCCLFSFAVDFVLKDPREREDEIKEPLPPHREELAIVPKPWNKSFVQGLDAMCHDLYAISPCMMQVLNLWHASFG